MPGSASGAVQVARMPRDIGTSTGVNDTDGSDAPQAAKFCKQLGSVAMDAAHAVGTRGPHELSAQQMRLERAARTRGAAGRNDDDIPAGGQTGSDSRQQRQSRRRRIAPGNRDRTRSGSACPVDRAARATRTARCPACVDW